MEEISFYKYIKDKKVTIGEVKLKTTLEKKILFTSFQNIYLNPKLWSVITKDFFLFKDFERYLSDFKHYKEILQRENEIKKIAKSSSIIKGNYFLFGAEENYWHFLIDFIPRLICLKYLSSKEIKIVISNKLPLKFLNFIEEICFLLNIKKIIYFSVDQKNLLCYFDRLTFTSRPTIEFTSLFFQKLIKTKKQRKKNIYVKRGNTIRRKVLNEDLLIEFLKEFNYEVVDCFELDIQEQINTFSMAKNIIIPSGAAMANLLFVPNNINVLEIRSNLDGNFSKKINLNNRFNLHLFENTTKVGLELRKDIIVDISAIKKLIEEKKIF